MKRKAWIIILIIAFSLMGTAYGAWTQVIVVSGTINTAQFNGSFSLRENDDTVTLIESNFKNDYAVEVNRQLTTNGSSDVSCEDTILVFNDSTIPAKYILDNKGTFSSSISAATYRVIPIQKNLNTASDVEMRDQNGNAKDIVNDKVKQEDKNRADEADLKEDNAIKENGLIKASPTHHEPETSITVTFSEAIEIPINQWTFSVSCSHQELPNLLYGEFISALESCLNHNVDVGLRHNIKITEKLNSGMDAIVLDNFNHSNSFEVESFDVTWSYDYEVHQVPFNQ